MGLILANVTGWGGWDGIASIVIGVLLASVAWVLAYEMRALLVGEAATREERSEIRAAVLSVSDVSAIGRLLTMQLSPQEVLVNLDLDLRPGLTDDEVERTIDRIEADIQRAVPAATRIFVELESAP